MATQLPASTAAALAARMGLLVAPVPSKSCRKGGGGGGGGGCRCGEGAWAQRQGAAPRTVPSTGVALGVGVDVAESAGVPDADGVADSLGDCVPEALPLGVCVCVRVDVGLHAVFCADSSRPGQRPCAAHDAPLSALVHRPATTAPKPVAGTWSVVLSTASYQVAEAAPLAA